MMMMMMSEDNRMAFRCLISEGCAVLINIITTIDKFLQSKSSTSFNIKQTLASFLSNYL